MTRASRSEREPSFWSAAVRRKRSVLRTIERDEKASARHLGQRAGSSAKVEEKRKESERRTC